MKTKLTFLFFSIGLCLLAQTPKDPAFKKISDKGLLTQTPKDTLFEYMKSATIYEVNVRQFSKEGTFEKVKNQLPRLKKMGVDIIWLFILLGSKIEKVLWVAIMLLKIIKE